MTPQARRAELVAQLRASGELEDSWVAAFVQVARHLFIPDTIWLVDHDTGGRLRPLFHDDDPDRWLRCAYQDRPVDIQVDDGHPAADGTGYEVTSSASQPSVVAGMLRALDPEPGMRVLEIGTGTGWNAALLAHRLGAENIVSLEIDPAVADQARGALDRAGFGKVTVITGNGEEGWPEGAPYDRVIATAGASVVPYPWVEQAAPDGRVVVPLTNTYQAPGVAVLTVDNLAATGRLASPAVFLGLRSQRIPRPRGADFPGGADSVGTTELHPYRWAGDRAAATAIGQRLGDGVHTHFASTSPNTGTQWLLDPASTSWASVDLDGTPPPYPVAQAGPRRLFDEAAAAYTWWVNTGKPGVEDWVVHISPHGQTITLQRRSTSCIWRRVPSSRN